MYAAINSTGGNSSSNIAATTATNAGRIVRRRAPGGGSARSAFTIILKTYPGGYGLPLIGETVTFLKDRYVRNSVANVYVCVVQCVFDLIEVLLRIPVYSTLFDSLICFITIVF